MMRSLVMAAALVLVAPAVWAHSHLEATVPADKAVLQASPAALVLHFSQPVRLTALTVRNDGNGNEQKPAVPKAKSADLTVAAPALGAGVYKVSWRAFSADGHVMKGSWSFTIAPAGDATHAH